MSTDLVVPPSVALPAPAELLGLAEAAAGYVEAAQAENTRKAYDHAWKDWKNWCASVGAEALPAYPGTVALFLVARAEAGVKVSTLRLRLAAIAARHRDAGHAFDARLPALAKAWAGIRRSKGVAPTKKAAALGEDVVKMVEALPDTLAGKRDRALLLIGFGAALRRSELVALDVADVTVTERGLVVRVKRSKTDQEGEGADIAIARSRRPERCPVVALSAWLSAAGISDGPLFRSIRRGGHVQAERLSDHTVAVVVKGAAKAAGLDPKAYSGHSLRAGLATSAALAGHDLVAVMAQTRHKSEAVARGYIRQADIWRNNVSDGLLD